MKSTKENARSITILGAGSMGITLARLYQSAGYTVTIWNRTPARVADLGAEGIHVAEDLVAALEASPVIQICVLDYTASQEILDMPGAAKALNGRTLIQLSTGSPAEARNMEDWLATAGAHLLAAALQVAPEQMGKPDTTILMSGKEELFQEHKALLDVLGGNIRYLGADITLASAMDLATLSTIYGTMVGFLHGARISEAAGFDIAAYGAIVAGIMPSFAGFLEHEAKVIHSGDFTISQSPLSISVGATQRILDAAEEAGINTEFPQLAAGWLSRAAQSGYGQEELAAVIKVLRASGKVPVTG